MKLKNLLTAATAAALMVSHQASATPVGLELMLLVDVSGSVNATEYALQRGGYVAAFQSTAVKNAIAANPTGSIAVTYIEWSSFNQQSTRVGWTLIDSATASDSFAAALNGLGARAFAGSTAIQDAIGLSFNAFGSEVTGGIANDFESLRQVIDVSGDGADNNSQTFAALGGGRDAAIAAGVDAVNAVAILGETGLATYYSTYVRGGTNGFSTSALTFDDFSVAIQNKLEREIQNVPEPGSLTLIGLGLLGLGAVRRRKSQG